MLNIVRAAASLAAVLLLAGCAGGASSPAPSPTAAASVAPSASTASTAVTSKTYGYSLTLPGGWTVIQATAAWDGGNEPSSHDVPQADQFVRPDGGSAWALVAPTTKDLKGYVQERIDVNAAGHSNTCPVVPDLQDPIKIGSEAATLLAYDCGILINLAVAVHEGKGYLFGFRDTAVHAATDPADRADFLALLASVEFPG
jgi:hypothetical protein